MRLFPANARRSGTSGRTACERLLDGSAPLVERTGGAWGEPYQRQADRLAELVEEGIGLRRLFDLHCADRCQLLSVAEQEVEARRGDSVGGVIPGAAAGDSRHLHHVGE